MDGADKMTAARLLLIFLLASFLLGFWFGIEWQRSEARYNAARFSYPSWLSKERALRLHRKVGPGYPLKITTDKVFMLKNDHWMVIRRRGI